MTDPNAEHELEGVRVLANQCRTRAWAIRGDEGPNWTADLLEAAANALSRGGAHQSDYARLRDCACRERCKGACFYPAMIAEAHRRVEAKLPEDEPDYTCAWVYRVAMDVAREVYSGGTPAQPEVTVESVMAEREARYGKCCEGSAPHCAAGCAMIEAMKRDQCVPPAQGGETRAAEPVAGTEIYAFLHDEIHEAQQVDPAAGMFGISTDDALAAHLAHRLVEEFRIYANDAAPGEGK